MLFAFSIPAFAAEANYSTSNERAQDTVSTEIDQTNTKYINVQFGDVDKKNLMLMVYQAQDGDNLFSIAQKYNTSPDLLKFLNQLQNENITPGQQLIVAVPQKQTLNIKLSPVNQTSDTQTLFTQFPTKQTPVNQSSIKKTSQSAIPYNANSRTIDPSIKNYTKQDLDILAHVVYGEARGESFKGQVAVASVVLNRTKSPLFSSTISGVVFQPFAYTAVNDGQYNLTPDNTAYAAAKEALRGDDPTNGALYYWNPTTATSKWVWSRTIIGTIGNHVFAK